MDTDTWIDTKHRYDDMLIPKKLGQMGMTKYACIYVYDIYNPHHNS